jgi:putative endonuclease
MARLNLIAAVMTDPSPPRTASQRTGNAGEAAVCQFLQDQGWQILAQQWHCRWGELDLVARKGSTLAFVEVKTRQIHTWDEAGVLAVTPSKQRKVIRSAQAFLSTFPGYADLDCRFDVALVQRRTPSSRSQAPHCQVLEYIAAAFEID